MKTVVICAILAPLLSSIVGATPIETVPEAVTHAVLGKRGHNLAANEFARCQPKSDRTYTLYDAVKILDSAQKKLSKKTEEQTLEEFLSGRKTYPKRWSRDFPGRSGIIMMYPITKSRMFNPVTHPDLLLFDENLQILDIINGYDGTSCARVQAYDENSQKFDTSGSMGPNEELCDNCR